MVARIELEQQWKYAAERDVISAMQRVASNIKALMIVAYGNYKIQHIAPRHVSLR